jgi:hypothetical protein
MIYVIHQFTYNADTDRKMRKIINDRKTSKFDEKHWSVHYKINQCIQVYLLQVWWLQTSMNISWMSKVQTQEEFWKQEDENDSYVQRNPNKITRLILSASLDWDTPRREVKHASWYVSEAISETIGSWGFWATQWLHSLIDSNFE